MQLPKGRLVLERTTGAMPNKSKIEGAVHGGKRAGDMSRLREKSVHLACPTWRVVEPSYSFNQHLEQPCGLLEVHF